ncbi:MAG: isopentenyl-diphosphate delta-isomerase [Clostridium cadaveris]|uniref:Isopentenyl-diphosphate delta-isomerase n=1 Tax=Clostridium cadaveris TaxID=1529 RepID=A0A316MBP7_9CLOT|nr:MAG: isopentenyl-diphosphate delta-isomerase [Clostridium cadaveris]
MEEVILVDTNDSEIGKMEKMQAHVEGSLHRAFSIFIFNSKGELLLQQREKGKYHSGGLWTNTCCSHPRVGEDINEAVHRRLKEEMGFDCDLSEKKTFLYHAKFDNDLIEHELDHIFIGYYNGVPIPNKEEVENWKWISTKDLKKELEAQPDKFTYWFKFSIEDVLAIMRE